MQPFGGRSVSVRVIPRRWDRSPYQWMACHSAHRKQFVCLLMRSAVNSICQACGRVLGRADPRRGALHPVLAGGSGYSDSGSRWKFLRHSALTDIATERGGWQECDAFADLRLAWPLCLPHDSGHGESVM